MRSTCPFVQAPPQQEGDQGVEDGHLDLYPHCVAGDEGQRAKRDAYCRSDEGHDRRPAEHPECADEREERADDQGPRPSGDAVQAVHNEHREERADLSDDIRCLFGIERKMPTPTHRLDCHALSFACVRVCAPGPRLADKLANAFVVPRALHRVTSGLEL